MTVETPQLLLVRQLATEADSQLARDDDFGHGLAVSLMQDAVELLIRIVIRTRSIEVPARATWEQMADAISKAAADEDGKVKLPLKTGVHSPIIKRRIFAAPPTSVVRTASG